MLHQKTHELLSQKRLQLTKSQLGAETLRISSQKRMSGAQSSMSWPLFLSSSQSLQYHFPFGGCSRPTHS